jgi:hypothetical protein
MKSVKLVGACLLASTISSTGAVWADQEVSEVKPSTRVTQNAPYDEMAVDSEAALLLQTIAEENAEIRQLASQQAMFRQLGGTENNRIARLFGRWIREHKASVASLTRLANQAGGNTLLAPPPKAPVLGSKSQMLHATMMDHMRAIQTAQQRYQLVSRFESSPQHRRAVQAAMSKRASLARKHMRQMQPFHSAKNCAMCANMMKTGKV